jgi:ABC-type phosphate/phosphonate transport system substrate-binding protein
VYEAEHTWTGRRVAVKMLLTRDEDGEARMERFRREARSAARLEHPNIVDILDMGRDAEDGALFLVQGLLVGADLEQRLERSPPLSAEELVTVLLPILDALRLAHRHGVLHRDIKPSNIFLVASSSGEIIPKLIDFGASKCLDDGPELLRLTQSGLIVGTPIYMSPEQLRGEPLDARTDIWSLGVVMYRVLTGRLPFNAVNITMLVNQILTVHAPPIEHRGVPRRLAAVVHRALATDRQERFSSVAAMIDALEALVHRSSHFPPIPEELTNVPAENERMEEPVDGRPPAPAGGPRAQGPFHVVAEPTPTPAPQAIRRARVLAVPARRAGRAPWRGQVRMGLAAPPLAGSDVLPRLEQVLGGRWSLRRFPSYSTLVDALCEDEIELAWLPPVAYLRARRLGPVHLLLALERGGDIAYGSALVVSDQAGIRALPEIRGKRVAWVDVWSAAGYLMPRGVLRDAGLDPAQVFASQAFVGSYAAVLDALESGRADLGATYCSIDEHGALIAGPWSERPGLRPLALSGAIPGDAICAAGELSVEDAEAMVEPLIALSTLTEGQTLLRRLFGAPGFAEVDPSYYQVLEGI